MSGEAYTHILVIGHPRGGTSILFNMLAAAWPQFDHQAAETRAAVDMARPGNRISKAPVDALARSEIVDAAKLHGKRLVVLQIIRDPRDVMTSRWFRDGYACYPEYYRNRDGEHIPRMGYLPLYYGLAEWRNTHEPILVLRYEDLVADPLKQQKRVERLLGREATGLQFEFFHQARHVPLKAGECANEITKAFVGRWRATEHAERIREVFAKSVEMRAAVRELGYEPDDGWIEEIG